MGSSAKGCKYESGVGRRDDLVAVSEVRRGVWLGLINEREKENGDEQLKCLEAETASGRHVTYPSGQPWSCERTGRRRVSFVLGLCCEGGARSGCSSEQTRWR